MGGILRDGAHYAALVIGYLCELAIVVGVGLGVLEHFQRRQAADAAEAAEVERAFATLGRRERLRVVRGSVVDEEKEGQR
jgi:hypothetical protein